MKLYIVNWHQKVTHTESEDRLGVGADFTHNNTCQCINGGDVVAGVLEDQRYVFPSLNLPGNMLF